MSRKHIVMVYKDFYPPVKGGIEFHIADIVKGLKDKFRFTVLVQSGKNTTQVEKTDGIEIIRASEFGRIQSAPLSASLVKYFRKLKPNIWHFHLPNPTAVIAYLSSFQTYGSLLVTYHSDIIRQKTLGCLYKPFSLIFLKKADAIIATSDAYAKSSDELKLFRNKTIAIPIGIDPPGFWQSMNVLAQVSEIKKKTEKPIILFIGKLRYYKGLHILIEAMKEIDAVLIIAGEGPMEKELKMIACKYDVLEKIVFEGEVSEERKWALLQSADIFCLPSTYRSEAYGICQIEAQLAGLPVVTTELGTGTSFVTIDKKTGYVIPPDDSKLLAKKIKKIIYDPLLKQKFGEAGRERAEKEFSLKLMLSRLEKVYNEL
ncbi:MAG: glycosyltransferase [Candidatus Coatesbacteria bacterium]|nr:glycosyltransferase [Candidatus Coatesbacteria bacterium]